MKKRARLLVFVLCIMSLFFFKKVKTKTLQKNTDLTHKIIEVKRHLNANEKSEHNLAGRRRQMPPWLSSSIPTEMFPVFGYNLEIDDS